MHLKIWTLPHFKQLLDNKINDRSLLVPSVHFDISSALHRPSSNQTNIPSRESYIQEFAHHSQIQYQAQQGFSYLNSIIHFHTCAVHKI